MRQKRKTTITFEEIAKFADETGASDQVRVASWDGNLTIWAVRAPHGQRTTIDNPPLTLSGSIKEIGVCMGDRIPDRDEVLARLAIIGVNKGSTDPENASRAAVTLTEDQYEDLTDRCCGICVKCGYIVDDDDFPLNAEHHKCESCGALEVFEIMKARQLGLIALKP